MQKKRHEILMSAQELVASGMAREGVRVAFDTDSPHVDLASRVIHVPPLAEEVSDDDVALLRAFIDHETAHLLYTDTGAMVGLDGTTRKILNAIEDGRVERLMGDHFYGCRLNQERAGELIRQLAQRRRQESGQRPSAQLQAMACLYYLSLGEDVPRAMDLAWADDPAVAGLLERVGDVIARFADLQTVDDVRECAVEIKRRWEEEKDQEEEEGEGEGKGEGKGKGKGKGKGEEREVPETMPWEASVGDALAEQVRARVGGTPSSAGTASAEGYLAWTDNDVVDTVSTKRSFKTSELYKEARKAVGPLSVRLMRDLLGRGRAWHRNATAGRVDPQKLHRVGVGDDRVFRRRLPRVKINSALAMLVDFSGSMRGNKLKLAVELAMAFSESCDLLDVPNAVLGFTTLASVPHIDTAAVSEEFLSRFHRVIPLQHYVIKPFEQRFHHRRHAFANAAGRPCRENIDGESVLWAGQYLCQRPEPNLTLLVLSDGYPAGGEGAPHSDVLDDHLRLTVARLEQAAVQVIGIGICSDAVSRFYREHVVVRDLDDLMREGYNTISQQLRGARRAS